MKKSSRIGIPIEEIQKKYFPDITDAELWKMFKKDLWEEVQEGKISIETYRKIVTKRR